MKKMEAVEYIHSLGFFSLPPTLDRIKTALNRLGNPQNSFPAIHIAGTNGKGSTAAFIAAALRSSEKKTGLFVSPYIIDFCERISINGEFIDGDDLALLTERVRDCGVSLTEFEFITAVCFLYFKEQKCDVAVIETGLGGRLDATNSLSNLKTSVITKIGLDHTAVLGDTISLISAEKCGIIKDAPAVTAPNQEKEALEVIKSHSNNLVIPDLSELEIIKISAGENEFIYRGEMYKTRLWGDYQIFNAITAIEALGVAFPEIDTHYIKEGLLSAQFPARLELFAGKPDIILDGAHNPDGAAALEPVLQKFAGNLTAIVGMLGDKSVDGVLALLLPHCKRVIAVDIENNPRALGKENLSEKCRKYCDEILTAESNSDAVSLAKKFGDTVIIFGSLYLASEIRPILLKQ